MKKVSSVIAIFLAMLFVFCGCAGKTDQPPQGDTEDPAAGEEYTLPREDGKNQITFYFNRIVGKFFLAILGTFAMLAVVFLGIMIAGSGIKLVAQIFQIGNTTKISNALFNACVGDWVNGYSINDIDVTSLRVPRARDCFVCYMTIKRLSEEIFQNLLTITKKWCIV